MAEKERYQNPVLGDTVNLRLISFNSNNLFDVYQIQKVEICQVICQDDKCCDVKELRPILEVPGSDVVREDIGSYLLKLDVTTPTFTVSKYVDNWYIEPNDSGSILQHKNQFEIFSDLWYFSSTPVIYTFNFEFQPHRIRKGSKQWLIIRLVPNVPRATDLERYYTNLATISNLYIYLEQSCGQCVPEEEDLRLLVDRQLVTRREKVYGYYFLDTTDLECGIYNLWFEMNFAGTTQISPKYQVQIFN